MAWALVFTFVLLDDALMFHEKIGSYLDAVFALPTLPGMRSQDTGELIVWGTAGALLLSALIQGFRSSTPETVEFSALLMLIFALLVFFGVGFDMLHIAAGDAFRFAGVLRTVAEDGGEMLAIALACAYSLLLCCHLSTKPDAIELRMAKHP